MKTRFRLQMLVALAILSSLVLSACGASTPEPTPTLSPEMIQTLAVATFQAGLTQTAIANPSPTPTATETPVPTNTPAPTNTPGTPLAPIGGPGAGLGPTASCYGMGFVSDVSIPDNTSMTPGQTFTKTWKVGNTGSCAWEVGFKFSFVGGDAMGGSTLTLSQAVQPGGTLELSVPMTAPTNKTGSIQGNWRMSTASGTPFGDEVYVIVNVGGSTATPSATGSAPSPSPTPSSTPTATNTPVTSP
jgi:hypothetical protein